MRNLKKPIFIVGSPRSGTTLLQSILSSASGVFSLPETHFFCLVLPYIRKSHMDILDKSDILNIFKILEKEASIKLPLYIINEIVSKSIKNQIKAVDIFEQIIEFYRPKRDKNKSLRLVEKTPHHALYISQISIIYPEAFFIHIVRDPVNVASSWMRTPFANSRSVLWYANEWNRIIHSVRHSHANIYTLRYEDLIESPEKTIRNACRFLGFTFNRRMITDFYKQLNKIILKNEYWKKGMVKDTIEGNKDAWKGRISEEQAWLINFASRKEREFYGYKSITSPNMIRMIFTLIKDLVILQNEKKDPITYLKLLIS